MRYRVFPRYRRPSVSTLLGVTRAKRRFKTATGYYSGPMKLFRFMQRVL